MHKIQRAHINVHRFIYLCIHNLALVDSGGGQLVNEQTIHGDHSDHSNHSNHSNHSLSLIHI